MSEPVVSGFGPSLPYVLKQGGGVWLRCMPQSLEVSPEFVRRLVGELRTSKIMYESGCDEVSYLAQFAALILKDAQAVLLGTNPNGGG